MNVPAERVALMLAALSAPKLYRLNGAKWEE
jgi:hypothetical protein